MNLSNKGAVKSLTLFMAYSASTNNYLIYSLYIFDVCSDSYDFEQLQFGYIDSIDNITKNSSRNRMRIANSDLHPVSLYLASIVTFVLSL